MTLSIIVPVLNEAKILATFLQQLKPLRAAGHQVIVVDGGSQDKSHCVAQPLCDVLLRSAPGRARQMNVGARRAEGEWLLFLHADTCLPQPEQNWLSLMQTTPRVWGRFDVRFTSTRWSLRMIGFFMNWRSALTGIATGDQALFVRRDQFEKLGGFAEIALMEDIDLCRRLKSVAAPLCLKQKVTTSSRRWEEQGVLRTVVLMWELRLRYFFGASPDYLVRRYGSIKNHRRAKMPTQQS